MGKKIPPDTLVHSLELKSLDVQDVRQIDMWLRVTETGYFAHATARAITSEASHAKARLSNVLGTLRVS